MLALILTNSKPKPNHFTPMWPHTDDPHANQPVLNGGAELDGAELYAIMLHGRGAHPNDMLGLASYFNQQHVRYIAPQAFNNTWYPFPFTYPPQQNEPFLTSALNRVGGLLEELYSHNITSDRIFLMGFSQGACLAIEFAARNPRSYAGIIGLSGGLIGDRIDPQRYQGSMNSTPVFLGCSDIDPHIPAERVHETEKIMKTLEADVTKKIYPGMGHTVNEDEIDFINGLINSGLAGT